MSYCIYWYFGVCRHGYGVTCIYMMTECDVMMVSWSDVTTLYLHQELALTNNPHVN